MVLACLVLIRTDLVSRPWGDPISEQSFYRIQHGMTEEEVTQILRRPGVAHGSGIRVWVGSDAIIQVDFDEITGKVQHKKLTRLAPRGPPPHV
jgi:hypothetical protein